VHSYMHLCDYSIDFFGMIPMQVTQSQNTKKKKKDLFRPMLS